MMQFCPLLLPYWCSRGVEVDIEELGPLLPMYGLRDLETYIKTVQTLFFSKRSKTVCNIYFFYKTIISL